MTKTHQRAGSSTGIGTNTQKPFTTLFGRDFLSQSPGMQGGPTQKQLDHLKHIHKQKLSMLEKLKLELALLQSSQNKKESIQNHRKENRKRDQSANSANSKFSQHASDDEHKQLAIVKQQSVKKLSTAWEEISSQSSERRSTSGLRIQTVNNGLSTSLFGEDYIALNLKFGKLKSQLLETLNLISYETVIEKNTLRHVRNRLKQQLFYDKQYQLNLEAKVGYTSNVIGDDASRVRLLNKHRIIATELSVSAVKNELTNRNSHRTEVVTKSNQLLAQEAKNNDELRNEMSQRKRRLDRARRKLEKLRSENATAKKQIEKQAQKLKNGEVEKEVIMNLYCLMQIRDCMKQKDSYYNNKKSATIALLKKPDQDSLDILKQILEFKVMFAEKINQKKNVLDHVIKTGKDLSFMSQSQNSNSTPGGKSQSISPLSEAIQQTMSRLSKRISKLDVSQLQYLLIGGNGNTTGQQQDIKISRGLSSQVVVNQDEKVNTPQKAALNLQRQNSTPSIPLIDESTFFHDLYCAVEENGKFFSKHSQQTAQRFFADLLQQLEKRYLHIESISKLYNDLSLLNKSKAKEFEQAQQELADLQQNGQDLSITNQMVANSISAEQTFLSCVKGQEKCEQIQAKKRQIEDETKEYLTFGGTVEGMLIELLRQVTFKIKVMDYISRKSFKSEKTMPKTATDNQLPTQNDGPDSNTQKTLTPSQSSPTNPTITTIYQQTQPQQSKEKQKKATNQPKQASASQMESNNNFLSLLTLRPCDLPDESLQDVVIIKNREILELVNLFEDAYGTSHQIIEERLQLQGGQRLEQASQEAEQTQQNSEKKKNNKEGEDQDSIETDENLDELSSPAATKPSQKKRTVTSMSDQVRKKGAIKIINPSAVKQLALKLKTTVSNQSQPPQQPQSLVEKDNLANQLQTQATKSSHGQESSSKTSNITDATRKGSRVGASQIYRSNNASKQSRDQKAKDQHPGGAGLSQLYRRSITSVTSKIKSKSDLLNLLTSAAAAVNNSDLSPGADSNYSDNPNSQAKVKESQRKFLKGIIKRYKFYFLSGYTMKFIQLLQANIEQMRSGLQEDIKEKLTSEAKLQIVRFFQQSKVTGIQEKYRYIINKRSASSRRRLQFEQMARTDEEFCTDISSDTDNQDSIVTPTAASGHLAHHDIIARHEAQKQNRANAKMIFEGLKKQAVTAIDFLVQPFPSHHHDTHRNNHHTNHHQSDIIGQQQHIQKANTVSGTAFAETTQTAKRTPSKNTVPSQDESLTQIEQDYIVEQRTSRQQQIPYNQAKSATLALLAQHQTSQNKGLNSRNEANTNHFHQYHSYFNTQQKQQNSQQVVPSYMRVTRIGTVEGGYKKQIKEVAKVMHSFKKADEQYIIQLKQSVEKAQHAMRRLDTVVQSTTSLNDNHDRLIYSTNGRFHGQLNRSQSARGDVVGRYSGQLDTNLRKYGSQERLQLLKYKNPFLQESSQATSKHVIAALRPQSTSSHRQSTNYMTRDNMTIRKSNLHRQNNLGTEVRQSQLLAGSESYHEAKERKMLRFNEDAQKVKQGGEAALSEVATTACTKETKQRTTLSNYGGF